MERSTMSNLNVHKLCVDKLRELNNISAKFDTRAPRIPTAKAIDVGRHNEVPDSDFDPKELTLGIEDEMEHTDDLNIAKAIAKDHLAKIPNYYTLLKLKGID